MRSSSVGVTNTGHELLCIPTSNPTLFALVNTTLNFQIGAAVSSQFCYDAAATAKSTLVCAWNGTQIAVHNYVTGAQVGGGASYLNDAARADCLPAPIRFALAPGNNNFGGGAFCDSEFSPLGQYAVAAHIRYAATGYIGSSWPNESKCTGALIQWSETGYVPSGAL